MAALLDNCRFNPTAGGTTDWTYSTAVLGYQSPLLAGAITTTVYECFAISADLTQWEMSRGACTVTGGVPTFARTTVLYNSSGTGTANGQSGAGTKISFSTTPLVAVVAIKESLISIEEANSFTATQRAQARTNISAVLKGHLFGLTLSTAGSSATFGIAAGEAADSTGVDLMALASAYTKTTSTWALGTGNGALDTSTIANSTWYHVFEIKRPDTGVVDVLISLSATAPTLPANYTLFRRIGAMKTNGSAQWTLFTQVGDDFLWDAKVSDLSTSPGNTTAHSLTLTVPTGTQVFANISTLTTSGTDTEGRALITSLDKSDEAAAGFGNVGQSTSNGTTTASPLQIRTNTSAQIRYRMASSLASIVVTTYGWIDTRGRYA